MAQHQSQYSPGQQPPFQYVSNFQPQANQQVGFQPQAFPQQAVGSVMSQQLGNSYPVQQPPPVQVSGFNPFQDDEPVAVQSPQQQQPAVPMQPQAAYNQFQVGYALLQSAPPRQGLYQQTGSSFPQAGFTDPQYQSYIPMQPGYAAGHSNPTGAGYQPTQPVTAITTPSSAGPANMLEASNPFMTQSVIGSFAKPVNQDLPVPVRSSKTVTPPTVNSNDQSYNSLSANQTMVSDFFGPQPGSDKSSQDVSLTAGKAPNTGTIPQERMMRITYLFDDKQYIDLPESTVERYRKMIQNAPQSSET